MAAILTNGVLKIRTAPIFQPLLAPARYRGSESAKARDVPPPMPRIVRPGGRQHRLELDAAPDGQAHSQPMITAHTDAAAQPNPCPTHTQNISSSNLLSFQRKNIRGARARTHFLLPLSLPPFAAKRLISLGLAV